jgi:Fe-S-cluster containining protein
VTNLFTPGAPRADIPCIANKCTKCCRETQMPLSLGDIDRLSALGHRLAEFSVANADGSIRLRNRADGACFFLEPSGRCGVNSVKPEGCRLYPFIWDEDARKTIRDDYCPYTEEFVPPPDVDAKVRELIGRLESESHGRLSPRSSKRF